MSDFEDVYARITFEGFINSADVDEIRSALEIIYSKPKGKALLDDISALVIKNNIDQGNHGGILDGQSTLLVDKNEITAASFIDANGKVFQANFVDVILHESIHAITGKDDNVATDYVTEGWDYEGPTVKQEKEIAAELNLEVRQGYEAALQNATLPSIGAVQGASLTMGREMSVIVSELKDREATDFDLSDRHFPVLVIGGYGDDSIRAGKAEDFVYGGDGQDRIVGHTGVDILFGNAGDDVIIGGTGNFGLIEAGLESGTFGKQTSTSDNAADYLVGGAGNDKFFVDGFAGYASAFQYDTQIHDLSYNQEVRGTFDVIRDFSPGDSLYVTIENADWMKFETIEFSSFALRNAGFSYGNKAVYVGTTGSYSLNAVYDTYFDDYLQQSITVLLFFEAELHTPIFGIEYHLPSLQQGSAGNDALLGTGSSDEMFGRDGDDSLEGGDGSDELTGGKGGDLLNGGGGSDTYYYAKHDGTDLVNDGADSRSKDFLLFSDLDFADLTFAKSGDDLVVLVNDTMESITLQGQYNDANPGRGIEIIAFASGGILELDHAADTSWSTGSSSADVIQGSAGKDYLIGREGADHITGGEGGDVYIYRNGDGNDTINDGSTSQQGSDVLHLIDLWYFEVTLERNGNDLLVLGNSGDVITIKDQFSSDSLYRGVERIQFADGTEWTLADLIEWFPNIVDGSSSNDSLLGTSGNDLIRSFAGDDNVEGLQGNDHLEGGLGSDLLNGGEGSDVYLYASGDGDDTISDEAIELGATDVLRFTDLNIGDLTISRDGEDLLITVNSTGHVILVNTQYYNPAEGWALEKIEFADGTSLALDHSPDTSWIYGTAASETIDGNLGKDYFLAAKGDDVINGSAGGDVYIYAAGDGNDIIIDDVGFNDNLDVLRFSDLNASDLVATRHEDDVELTVVSTGEVITLKGQLFDDPTYWGGIDQIEFADGSSWNRDAITQFGLNAVTVLGTNGDDTLLGTSGHDVFNGGLGDDYFLGGYGSDTYLYAAGDGTDYIDDEANAANQVDVLQFTDLNQSDIIAAPDGVNLKLTVVSTGATITLDEQYYADTDYWGFEKIEFADGSFWNRETIMSIGSSSLNAAPITMAVANDDVFDGTASDDTFVFSSNFGHDTIIDFVAGEGTDDVIDVSTDVFADFAAVLAAATQVGDDALITHDTSNSILLKNIALANLHQDDFRFTAAA